MAKKKRKRSRKVGKPRRRRHAVGSHRKRSRRRRIGKGHMRWGNIKAHRRRVAKPKRKRSRRSSRRIGAVPGGLLSTMSSIKKLF